MESSWIAALQQATAAITSLFVWIWIFVKAMRYHLHIGTKRFRWLFMAAVAVGVVGSLAVRGLALWDGTQFQTLIDTIRLAHSTAILIIGIALLAAWPQSQADAAKVGGRRYDDPPEKQ